MNYSVFNIKINYYCPDILNKLTLSCDLLTFFFLTPGKLRKSEDCLLQIFCFKCQCPIYNISAMRTLKYNTENFFIITNIIKLLHLEMLIHINFSIYLYEKKI